MSRYIRPIGILILILVGSAVGRYYYLRHSSDRGSERPPYFLSTAEMKGLEVKSTRGDCDASIQLAKYYLYSALDIDKATKWLRVAARCPDPVPKQFLIEVLMHNKDDPKIAAEIEQLIVEIRTFDPAKAAMFEDRLKNKVQSQ